MSYMSGAGAGPGGRDAYSVAGPGGASVLGPHRPDTAKADSLRQSHTEKLIVSQIQLQNCAAGPWMTNGKACTDVAWCAEYWTCTAITLRRSLLLVATGL